MVPSLKLFSAQFNPACLCVPDNKILKLEHTFNIKVQCDPWGFKVCALRSNRHVTFCRVVRRMVTLINQLATLHLTSAALQIEADSNNQALRKYMENNELLKQVRRDAFNPGGHLITMDSPSQNHSWYMAGWLVLVFLGKKRKHDCFNWLNNHKDSCSLIYW